MTNALAPIKVKQTDLCMALLKLMIVLVFSINSQIEVILL